MQAAFRKLIRYNAWANAQMVAALQDMPEADLATPSSGMLDSISETVNHLFNGEATFLNELTGTTESVLGERSLTGYREAIPRLEAGYLGWLDGTDGEALSERLYAPWNGYGTHLDALSEIILHSHQHRAEVFSELGRRGLAIPKYEFTSYVYRVDPGRAGKP